jgi:hypothetical protein
MAVSGRPNTRVTAQKFFGSFFQKRTALLALPSLMSFIAQNMKTISNP